MPLPANVSGKVQLLAKSVDSSEYEVGMSSGGLKVKDGCGQTALELGSVDRYRCQA